MTFNNGARSVAAEGVGRGGMVNNHLEEQHLLLQINKKRVDKAGIGNELMILYYQ